MTADLAATLREFKGHQVHLSLKTAPDELSGRLRGLLESADGLVVYMVDERSRVHTIHSHLITEVRAAGTA